MRVVDLIRHKRDGGVLEPAVIAQLVRDVTAGVVPDYQLAAWLMAVYFRGLNADETRALTQAMLHSGEVLDFAALGRPVADKHSTGGVGDKTSLVVAPLAAACGVLVPMISGRGLGHTGGTLDKLASIPGFRTDLDAAEFRRVLECAGCAISGQTATLAPADRRLYALRDVTATVEEISLITASILSKKLAEGLHALVLDVKTGDGAFMKRIEDARRLADVMVAVGTEMGVAVQAVLSDMEQPLGRTVGNALEVEECLEVLQDRGPADLRYLCIELTARLLVLARPAPRTPETLQAARAECAQALATGRAQRTFLSMAAAQGADPRSLQEPGALPQAGRSAVFTAATSGYVHAARAHQLGEAAMLLGAGRATLADVIDPAVGLRLHRKIGEAVTCGEPLCTAYFNRPENWVAVQELLSQAFVIGAEAPPQRPLLQDVIG